MLLPDVLLLFKRKKINFEYTSLCHFVMLIRKNIKKCYQVFIKGHNKNKKVEVKENEHHRFMVCF